MHSDPAQENPPQGEDPRWTLIAERRPRLHEHVQFHRHVYRGRTWYVLHDRVAGRFHRFDAATHAFLCALDGKHSLRAIRERLVATDDAPQMQPGELVDLFNRMHASDLLRWDLAPDIGALHARQRHQRRSRWVARLRTPFIVRLSLFDPDRFLNRCIRHTGWLFGPAGFALWAIVLLAGLGTALLHAGEMTAYWSSRALAPDRLLLLALVFVLIKAAHEFAHGLATRHWGGEVHEMGVMLLVFMPVPYVDASAASTFADKRRRMIVGSAGIMAELFIAALAAIAWVLVEAGTVRDMALAAMLVGGVSTLFFNGNPLLRFDGYYVLSDLIEIPNLSPRANRYYGYLARRYLFGQRGVASPVTASGERGWFLVYGLASLAYRVAVTLGIALFVAGKFLVLGVIAAVWGIVGQILYPAAKNIAGLLAGPGPRPARPRVLAVFFVFSMMLIALLFALPLPLRTHVEGIVWLPEDARLFAGADGFVERVLVPDGHPVEEGDPLLILSDPLLDLQVRSLEWSVAELEARHGAAILGDRVEREILDAAVARKRADLEQARSRHAALTLRSPGAGILVLPDTEDLPGRFLRKGDSVGYVLDTEKTTIRTALPQKAIGLVRQRTGAVQVRLAATSRSSLPARVAREIPAATHTLPSPALGTRGGGRIALDPGDEEGRQAQEQHFEVDLVLAHTRVARLGMRAYVRFDHGRQAPAKRLFDSFRRLFLSHFSV